MTIAPAVLRPVREADAASLWALLEPATGEVVGMSSLPADPDGAERMCADSAATVADLATGSFRLADGGHRRLLFVVDGGEGRPLGVTGVTFKRSVPNLAVQVATSADGQGLVMASSSVPWTRTELDSTYLGPLARGRRLGTLLSRGRFMFLHLVASQVPSTVASHLRGRFDEDGSAPFWGCFGSHVSPDWLTSTEAEQALIEDPKRLDRLAGHRLPLTAEVLESLGPVNAASLPAFHLLQAEGLRPNGMYDPVDGGPTLVADVGETITGRLRVHGRARIVDRENVDPVDGLVSVAGVDRFRVARAGIRVGDGTIAVSGGIARALRIETDALLAAAPLETERHPELDAERQAGSSRKGRP